MSHIVIEPLDNDPAGRWGAGKMSYEVQPDGSLQISMDLTVCVNLDAALRHAGRLARLKQNPPA